MRAGQQAVGLGSSPHPWAPALPAQQSSQAKGVSAVGTPASSIFLPYCHPGPGPPMASLQGTPEGAGGLKEGGVGKTGQLGPKLQPQTQGSWRRRVGGRLQSEGFRVPMATGHWTSTQVLETTSDKGMGKEQEERGR